MARELKVSIPHELGAEEAARRHVARHPEDVAGDKLPARIALERRETAGVVAPLDKAQASEMTGELQKTTEWSAW